uniref:Uncharacterized protein n=1 Tax=Magallana gigas TaxID=29159 RepID=A0A8W8JG01_MAGGI
MIIRVHFNLLLAVLLIQWCKNESKICQEAIVSSVKSVPKCPTLKENWDIAAKKKNCFDVASQKQCSMAEKFKYHCVINSYRNETLEVCAHNLLIFDVCTEFNVAGGVLQGQNDAVCNDKFPKCDKIYSSTDAYKYPDCYKLINNTRDNLITTMPSTETTSYQTEKITMELQLEKWWDEFEKIYAKYFAVNEETNSFRLRIIMTARQNAITRACSYMDKTPPILHDNFVKDVSRLTEAEKDQIFKTQIEFAKKEKNISVYDIDEAFRAKVKKSDGPIGFPLCAHLFVCGREYRKSGERFFTHPIQYLKLQIKDEIESDKTNRTKSLFFYLFFFEWYTKMGYLEKIDLRNESNCKRFLERISGNLLEKFDPFDFKDMEAEAQRLSGAFFKKFGKNAYRFVHDSVYEAVGTYFCETYVTEAAKYFPLDIIRNQNFDFLTQGQKEILSTTNGMFRDNYEKIKDHVQSFVDKEGNCILHILIASKCSDWFAAIAVETLGEDGMSIDSRNNDNVTPLMVTVEQTLPRMDVLQNLIKFSRKLNYKDREDSTMFHHCLRSSNNDETCAEYLEILINKLDGLKSLSNNDVNGDTALSIAAKETKRSRILSILKLLESGVDITNTLNKEGYSPLHLSVKSLKAGSTWVELECCVRVITLIIFGANPEKLSDGNVKAIDECASSYGCVKDILSKPTDKENMEYHLDLLLEKAKKHKGEKKQKQVCISSNKLSAGLLTRIEQAVCNIPDQF